MSSAYPPDPECTAFVGEAPLTFGQVQSKARAIAQALGAAGLKAGDVVAIATTHAADFYECFAACFSCGIAVAIIDPAAGLRELNLMLRKAAASALIADDDVLQRLTAIDAKILPRYVWRVDPSEPEGERTQPAATERKRIVAKYPALDELEASKTTPLAVSGRGELPAYIIFTSGSTSDPKAVVISRHALRYHVATLSKVFGYNQEARLLHYLPMHHTDGLVHGVAASLLTGMTVVHPGSFNASVNLEQALRANEISHFLAVPAILSMIKHTYGDCQELFQYDSFRHVISTAGYLDAKFWEEFQDLFGVRVSNFYGMTETVSGSLYCGPDNETYRIGTVGKPIDAQARIVNESGEVLPVEKIGELQISGMHLMSGYLDDPGATGATMVDSWLSTGDLFYQDVDGFFHIVGRKKNVIKRGGITVYPEDIRRVLMNMPGIVDAEVVGLPDAMFEEIIVVCAVVQDGVDADEIRALCRRELAPERRPDRIEILDELPRGPSGKVQRDALISELERNEPRVTSRDSSMHSRVFDLAAEIFATASADLVEASSPDTVDNWDSYAGMEFVLALEQEFNVQLRAADIMRIGNIGQALEVVMDAVRIGDKSE